MLTPPLRTVVSASRLVIASLVVAISLFGSSRIVQAQAFVHPGLLETNADFTRMAAKVAANEHPWVNSWNILINNPESQTTWTPNPAPIIYRGGNYPQNYSQLYYDAAAAY